MKNTDLAYIAGILDGEGYLGITTKGKRKDGLFKYQVILRVQLCDKKTVEYLSKVFDCPVATYYKDHLVWRDAYSVSLYDGKASNFIEKVCPYLRIKKQQAKIIIKFRKFITRGRNQFSTDTLQMVEKQKMLYIKIRKLNHRGKII